MYHCIGLFSLFPVLLKLALYKNIEKVSMLYLYWCTPIAIKRSDVDGICLDTRVPEFV